ncbi:hypothetical protein QAD02_022925, partial [Eretmocerus hayati]
GEQGSRESGLSYECRSLLFKALHNLIERCLLSRDFVRLGKWFVQPYDGSDKHRCPRQHPAVRHLTRACLQRIQASQSPVKVILAPYGLAGTLTGQVGRVDSQLLDEWKHFYPINSSGLEPGLPALVEVLVGGVRMRYPSCYVLVTDMDESPLVTMAMASNQAGNGANQHQHGPSGTPLSTSGHTSSNVCHGPPSGVTQGMPGGNNNTVQQHQINGPGIMEITLPLSPPTSPASYEHPLSMQRELGPATELPERVWAECIVGSDRHNTELGNWNFADPTLRTSCSCSKARGSKRSKKKSSEESKQTSHKSSSGSTSNSTSSNNNSSSSGNSPHVGGSNSSNSSKSGSGGSSSAASGTSSSSGSGSSKEKGSSSSNRSSRSSMVPFHRRPNLNWDPTTSTTPARCPPTRAPTMPANTPRVTLTRPDSSKTPPADGSNTPSYPRSVGPGSVGPQPQSQQQSQQQQQQQQSGGSSGDGSGGGAQAVASVGSAAGSPGPSPLPTPHSEQPASVPPAGGDALNSAAPPSLSPQPHHSGSQPPSSAAQPPLTPSQQGPKSISSSSAQPSSPITLCGSQGQSQSMHQHHQHHQHRQHSNYAPVILSLKRPMLNSREYESALMEDEQQLPWLYDYSTQEAWLNHPVKRVKLTPTPLERSLGSANLYPPTPSLSNVDGQPGGTAASGSATPEHQQQQQQLTSSSSLGKVEIKQEPGLASGEYLSGRPDPYEFDVTGEENGAGVDGLKRQRDESKPSSLFTSEGLQASYKDLDQIFDNSDPDTSSDETHLNQLQVQTPPGSNKSGGGGIHDGQDTRLDGAGGVGSTGSNANCSSSGKLNNSSSSSSSSSNCNRSVGVLRPEELSKMFPTPPSLEHNPVASPCQMSDPSLEQTELGMSTQLVQQRSTYQQQQRQTPDIYPNMGSPPEEPIEDWSYVFRPPTICKLVGSSKYAPLTNLPSQSLPPVILPPHCIYRSSWQCSNANPERSNHEKSTQQTRTLLPASPAQLGIPYRGPQMAGAVRPPPPPYDQPSPATSTTSSYLNKNLNSIEPDTPGPIRMPESNSLMVNILLGDTALNIFRDHNFDSCSLCVCNAGPKVVGNIKGADAGTYLAGSWGNNSNVFQEDDQIRCSCGFSAVVNRRLAHRAGLFYEDEMEITGIAEDPAEKKKASLAAIACCDSKSPPEGIDVVPLSVLELLREQCLIVQSSASSMYRAARLYANNRTRPSALSVNTLEYNDGNELSLAAIDQGKLDGNVDRNQRMSGVHSWSFLRAKGPQCNGDIIRVMKTVQPLLQEAIQQKATRMWDAPYTVRILTWRGFHRLAGRDTKDRCEPQPVPALVVGYDRDWLSLSPYALSYWEKLLLEPYAGPRDVAYVVLSPDNDYVVSKVKTFFRELSTTYEICRLYAQACNNRLAPYLTQVIQDRSVFDTGEYMSGVNKSHLSANVTETMPATPDGTPIKPEPSDGENARGETPSNTTTSNANSTAAGNTTPTLQNSTTPSNQTNANTASNQQQQAQQNTTLGPDEDELELPSVVVYLVEPFSLGGADCPDRRRLAILALLRAFATAVSSMPENIRGNINVQLISLESVMELGRVRERRKIQDEMRALALNVFLQSRRLLSHVSTVRSLTGFGTAAAADLFLKNKDSCESNILTTPHQERNKASLRLYAPAYVLAPLRCKSEAPDSFGTTGPEECSVLYLSYCLSEDQSWLLAVATDDRGEIFETATINVDIPNRKRRKRASARRVGLQKLMDFILGVMSQGVQPWRLVVGRVGRIGHGELKGWSWLLSRKALLKASKHLKDICGQCNLLYPAAAPCVLSACLVSLEPDSSLRLMADQFTPDERFSAASVNCQLATPQDVSCTHILVFPTSATTQSSQTAFHEQQINDPELGDDVLFALDDDLPEGMEGMGDFNDIFNWPEHGAGGGPSPSGSPRRPEGSPLGGDGPGSSLGNHDGPGSPFPCSNTPRTATTEQAEEVGTLLQQPLALGYLVSTAPTGRMPSWFWAACPHLEGVCPVFLKNALHLHSPAIQQNSDELLHQQSAVTVHGLDSQFTTDVLRYVLEGYNALSWLSVDANTKDRLSCLPVHIQALMQLYHATAALV